MNNLLLLSALEKFASNGVRAFLVVYFIKHLNLGVSDALGHTAAILSLNYLLPLFWGYMFDKVPILRDNIRLMIGAISIGSFAFAYIGLSYFESFIAAVLIVTALLRAAVPIWIRQVLQPGDSEAVAFTQMYSYFNWGTMLGTLFIAILGEVIGWDICFIMTSGTLLFAAYLAPGTIQFTKSSLAALLLSIPIVYIVQRALSFKYYSEGLMLLMICGVAYLFFYFLKRKSISPVMSWLGFIFLIISHAFFFAIYEQASTSYTSVVLEKLSLMESNIPATSFQLIDPGLNVVLGILFAQMWSTRRMGDLSINTHARFGLGFLLIVPGLLALQLGFGDTTLFEFIAIFVVASIMFVMGEQMIIPAGFGEVSRISDQKSRGTLIGIWYLGIAFSEQVAGFIGRSLSGGTTVDASKYTSGLSQLALFCLGLAAIHFGIVATQWKKKRLIQKLPLSSDQLV